VTDAVVPFTVGVDQHGHRAVLTLVGELDMTSAPQLAEWLDRIFHAGGSEVVLDLSGLRFCDSSGLRTFVTAAKRCTAVEGWLRLAGPRPDLVTMLAITSLLTVVPTYPSLDAALHGNPHERIDD
jgi:anti-anti-sigma factor